MKPTVSEADVIARAASGDEAAFESLVIRHQDRVYALALRLTGNEVEAEDVAQEAFIKAYRGLASFQGKSAFFTWLFRIAFNVARSRQRAAGRRRIVEAPMLAAARVADDPRAAEPADSSPGPSDLAEARDERQRVRRAIEALEPDHREAVVLRDVEGLSYEEIARVMGVTRAAVKSRLHRARMALASLLKDGG